MVTAGSAKPRFSAGHGRGDPLDFAGGYFQQVGDKAFAEDLLSIRSRCAGASSVRHSSASASVDDHRPALMMKSGCRDSRPQERVGRGRGAEGVVVRCPAPAVQRQLGIVWSLMTQPTGTGHEDVAGFAWMLEGRKTHHAEFGDGCASACFRVEVGDDQCVRPGPSTRWTRRLGHGPAHLTEPLNCGEEPGTLEARGIFKGPGGRPRTPPPTRASTPSAVAGGSGSGAAVGGECA